MLHFSYNSLFRGSLGGVGNIKAQFKPTEPLSGKLEVGEGLSAPSVLRVVTLPLI